MASKLVRGLWPQRPLTRIVLLLGVAGAAIIVAAVVFAGPSDTEPSGVVAAVEPSTADPSPPNPPTTSPVTSPGSQPADSDTVGATTGTGDQEAQSAEGSAAANEPTSEVTTPTTVTATDPAATEPAPTADSPPTDQAAAADSPPTEQAPAADPPAADEPTTTADPPATDQAPAADPPPAAEPTTTANTPIPPTTVPASEPPEVTEEVSGGAAQRSDGITGLLEQLRPLVAEPQTNIPSYDRDHFAGWLDSDGDCVNTRHEILQAEASNYSMAASGCLVAAGEWYDPYTDRTYTNPRDLDVDHVVALADAWVSGAYAWADEILDRFSNDLVNLNAIAAGENRSKSAKGPAAYTPSAPGARCDYLMQYATVKIRWQLSITPADFAATESGLAGCNVDGAGEVTPQAARTRSQAVTAPSTTTTALPGCHPDYSPCLPNLPGDALNCGDLTREQRPVTVLVVGTDPYRLDRDENGTACTG